jgi:hypothetical protein
MGNDTWRLFREKFRGQHNEGFQCDLVTYVLTIPDLVYKPLLLSHTAPPDYAVIV